MPPVVDYRWRRLRDRQTSNPSLCDAGLCPWCRGLMSVCRSGMWYQGFCETCGARGPLRSTVLFAAEACAAPSRRRVVSHLAAKRQCSKVTLVTQGATHAEHPSL